MNLLPEQLSAAGKHQLDAQLQLLRQATGTAFDSAEKLMALQFDATRTTLAQSTALLRQVAAARDPRDFFALASQGQAQLDTALAYQRKLFGLASTIGSSLTGLPPAPTPAASAALEKLAALPPVAEAAAQTAAPAPASDIAEVAVELIDTASAPVARAELPPAQPIAELTAVAAASGHQQEHPSAAPVDAAAPEQEAQQVQEPQQAQAAQEPAAPNHGPAMRQGGRAKKR